MSIFALDFFSGMIGINKYRELNKSFRDKLVFRVGYYWGFFSEYNNMLLVMHYCLLNKIRFVIDSRNANFSHTEKGWTDYFLPFTTEYRFYLLEQYNTRYGISKFRNLKEKFVFKIYRILFNIRYLTVDIFEKARTSQNENDIYNIPELGLNGTLRENCSKLHRMVWRYQPDVAEKINQIIETISINEPFIGLHIRQGDKKTEVDLFNPEDYIRKAEKLTAIKTAFVATDDYSVIEQLQQKFTQWRFYTLCTPSERGYKHDEFLDMSKDKKFYSLIRFFAEMDILEKSDLFIGTFSSNIAMNMGFRKEENQVFGLDSDRWKCW